MSVEFFKKISIFILKSLPGVQKISIGENMFIIQIEKDWLKSCVLILKNNLNFCFNSIIDIVVVDYPSCKKRFEVSYYLNSFKYKYRIVLRIFIDEKESVETLSDVFGSVGWLEREI